MTLVLKIFISIKVILMSKLEQESTGVSLAGMLTIFMHVIMIHVHAQVWKWKSANLILVGVVRRDWNPKICLGQLVS